MTLSEWIENYCEENNIELPSGIPDEKTSLQFLSVNASGGGGSLPSVTSADEGKVLAVNASGEWAAERQGLLFTNEALEVTFTFNDILGLIRKNIIPELWDITEKEDYIFYGRYVFLSAEYNGENYKVVFSLPNTPAASYVVQFSANDPNTIMIGADE